MGLLHDAGKASCSWQKKLLVVEGTDRPVGCDHKTLGAKMLRGSSRKAVMVILGHHGGLTDVDEFLDALDRSQADEAETVARLYTQVPEARDVIDGPVLVPESWRQERLLLEMSIRRVFSALVDAELLAAYSHIVQAADLRRFHAVALTNAV